MTTAKAMKNSTMLRRVLKKDPTDTTVMLLLADALEEEGCPGAALKQRKAACSQDEINKARQHFRGCGLSDDQKRRVRAAAGLSRSRCPIEVIDGDSSPVSLGEEGHNIFKKGGGICKNAGAAIRAGYKVRYVASTLRIEVGIDWLVRNFKYKE